MIYRKNETILILISLKLYFSHPEKSILNLSLGGIVIPGPGICLTPSQVDILVSDDSHAFCPSQLCITEFLLGYQSQIRIKSEVGTVKHFEALQFFFLLAKILSIVF